MNPADIPDDLDLSHLAPQDRVVMEEYLRRKKLRNKANSFLDFAQHVYPTLVVEEVHVLIAAHFEMLKAGEIDRLMIMMPPRTGKSLFTSELLPAWWEGHAPSDKMLHASYAATLVGEFGRKIRNMLTLPEYHEIFPETRLSKDSKANDKWATTKGGEYNAVGVGGGVAGKGGNLMLIDDPVNEQDMFSKSAHNAVYEWYGAGFYSRRQSGKNALILTMCMTGDTPVLMANGIEKPLCDVRPGDEVATYDDGMLTTTRVRDWKSNGVDAILTVRTRSGRLLRANERHPFLVESEGEQRWIRLKHLKPGDRLVSLKGAQDLLGQKPRQDCATRVLQKRRITRNTLMRLFSQWGIMGNGKRNCAVVEDAMNPLVAMGFVRVTTARNDGRMVRADQHQSNDVINGSSRGTGLLKKISTGFSKSKEVFAQCVANLLPQRTLALTGTTSCALTIATTPIRYEGYSAMTATSQSVMQRPQQQQMLWPDTCDFTTDQVVEIRQSGKEEVFDVEIERTENFIANGVVSHNTRWRCDDLCGRLLADGVTNPGADQWTILKIPAIIDEETADLLNDCSSDPHITTPHFYKAGDSFSPRRWPYEELMRTKATITRKAWASLYMQSPTEEGGGILLRDWWKAWKEDKPLPECEYILQSYDTAFEEGEANDYSARITWGVFKRPSDGKMCAIMLERLKERLSFPLLLDNALVSYEEYKPDRIVVEKAASGIPLIQEMRKRGIPVTPVKPVGSKIARANAATILLEQGVIYYPDRKWARDVIDECAEFPNGPHDDLCFVAGTLVATPQGERRIEDIVVGDEVTTPFGNRRVLRVGGTGVQRVREYVLANGGKLVGTPGHPVFSRNRFIAIDKLSSSDKLVSNILPEGRQSWGLSLRVWFGLKLWSLRGVGIAGIRILRESMPEGILGGLEDFCIETFGRRRMAQSPQSITFTTSMAIQGTIGLRIWSWCPRENIFKSTEHRSEGSAQNIWCGLQNSEIRQKRGTHPQKVVSGISSMQQKQVLIKEDIIHLSCANWFVRSARKSIARKLLGLNIVASVANVKRAISGVEQSLCVWKEYVRNAVKSLWGKDRTQDSAHLGAESDSIISSNDHVAERVFNLQVDGVSCYYANGILVHNCDAVVHGLNFLRRMFLLDTPADDEDKEKPEEYDPAAAQTHRSYARRQSRMSVNAH